MTRVLWLTIAFAALLALLPGAPLVTCVILLGVAAVLNESRGRLA